MFHRPLLALQMRTTPTKEGLSPFVIVLGRPSYLPPFGTVQNEDELTTSEDMLNVLTAKKVVSANAFLQEEAQQDNTVKPSDWVLMKAKTLVFSKVGQTIPCATDHTNCSEDH